MVRDLKQFRGETRRRREGKDGEEEIRYGMEREGTEECREKVRKGWQGREKRGKGGAQEEGKRGGGRDGEKRSAGEEGGGRRQEGGWSRYLK
jgi:hypothetical protein